LDGTWFDTRKCSPNKSLSFKRLIRAGGGMVGNSRPPPDPLRTPRSNMLEKRSIDFLWPSHDCADWQAPSYVVG
jgi:hypothetical protein